MRQPDRHRFATASSGAAHAEDAVVPIDTAAVCSEIQKTWSRPDAAQWAEAYSALFPPYQLLIESYSKAQEVVTQHEQLDSVLA